jgi:hypothetical protein
MRRTVASRSIGRGLAKIEPASPNTLIAYSAKAGSTALDGDASNSPFTLALAKHLTTPGLDVRRAFGFVRDDVLKTTANRQEPFVYGSLGGDDVPLVPAKAVVSTPAPASASNPLAEARRDYELALQVGNKDAWNAFLVQYPDGFYASLAKVQLEKIVAEEARVAATEKARQAEQERARLVAEGAQTAQQAKADADARAAEQARISAEKAKQVAQEQAAEAERKRASAEPSAADKTQGEKGMRLASLSSGPPQAEIVKSVQSELRRVGCLTAQADGEWNTASQRSMALFNRHAGTKFDVKLASTDALDAIKLKSARVCPLVCEHGYKADGDSCTKITCAAGSFLNDDNECEKRRDRPVAKRDTDDRQRAVPPRSDARQAPEARQAIARPSQSRNAPGIGQYGQTLTGQERMQGCNGYGAIMSGRCP